eukprot:COSAG01_NODE_37313_length_505_cov_0.862069_1_plen_97_part_01
MHMAGASRIKYGGLACRKPLELAHVEADLHRNTIALPLVHDVAKPQLLGKRRPALRRCSVPSIIQSHAMRAAVLHGNSHLARRHSPGGGRVPVRACT